MSSPDPLLCPFMSSRISSEFCCVIFTGLRICGIDCMLSAEWKSPNKIVARTGQAKGKGDIIVTTRSGGVGTCTVQFKCYHVTTGNYCHYFMTAESNSTWKPWKWQYIWKPWRNAGISWILMTIPGNWFEPWKNQWALIVCSHCSTPRPIQTPIKNGL